MRITLSPIRADWPAPVLVASGAVLTIDGQAIDLTLYDAEADPHPMIIGQPVLAEGDWQVTVLLPHPADAPEAMLWPEPVEVEAGEVTLPQPPEIEPDSAEGEGEGEQEAEASQS